jgi:parallel beta-helix repeat protein
MGQRSVLLSLLVVVASFLTTGSADAAIPVVHHACDDQVASSARLGRSIFNCAASEVLTITQSGVTLDLGDFTVRGTSGCSAVIAVAPGLSNVRIKGPGLIIGCPIGVKLGPGVNASKITGVSIKDTTVSAIELTTAPSNTITGNAIYENTGSHTVALIGSNGTKILDNDISANGGNAAIWADPTSHRTLVGANRIVGNASSGVEFNDDGSVPQANVVANNVIRFNESVGVDALGPVVIKDNRILENEDSGILVVDGAKILRNIVARNDGYGLYGDDNNLLKGNIFTSSNDGVALSDGNDVIDNVIRTSSGELSFSDDNVVTGNTVTGSTASGIAISGSNNLVSGNVSSNHAIHGIEVGSGNGNTIRSNKTIGNRGDGILLETAVTVATIKGNTANNNGFDNGVGTGDNFGIRAPDVAGIDADGTNFAKRNDVAVPAVQCNPDRLCVGP